MSFYQKLMKLFSSKATFQKMEEESKKWKARCECGYEMNVWETGGIRYKAAGSPSVLLSCPSCGKSAMRTLRYSV